MGKIDFQIDCRLTQYLCETAILSDGRKSHYAGSLLWGFGYPSFTHSPDIKTIELLVQEIAKTMESDLLYEAMKTCVDCPLSGNCAVGALFKSG